MRVFNFVYFIVSNINNLKLNNAKSRMQNIKRKRNSREDRHLQEQNH